MDGSDSCRIVVFSLENVWSTNAKLDNTVMSSIEEFVSFVLGLISVEFGSIVVVVSESIKNVSLTISVLLIDVVLIATVVVVIFEVCLVAQNTDPHSVLLHHWTGLIYPTWVSK